MDETTDYVHTAVINYEPTYLALMSAVDGEIDAQELKAAITQHRQGAHLSVQDLHEVDCVAMIEWERANV